MSLNFEQWQARAKNLGYGALRDTVDAMNLLPGCGVWFYAAKAELSSKTENHRQILECGYSEWKVACQNLKTSKALFGERFELQGNDTANGFVTVLRDKATDCTVKVFNVLEDGRAMVGLRTWPDVFQAARVAIAAYLQDEVSRQKMRDRMLARLGA